MADTDRSTIPPFRRQAVDVKDLDDGAILLRSPYNVSTVTLPSIVWLDHWADLAPDRIFIRQQTGKREIRDINFAEAKRQTGALASALNGAESGKSVVVLSENSIDAAIVQLAAMARTLPVATLEPELSLGSRTTEKLRDFLATLNPQVVFAGDGKKYSGGLQASAGAGAQCWISETPHRKAGAVQLEELLKSIESAAVLPLPNSMDAARIQFSAQGAAPDHGYVTTFAMRTSFQGGLAQLWPFLTSTPPILMDRIPWHHPVGANLVFDLVLRHGGTLLMPSIGEKKPLRAFHGDPALSPTLHIDTSRGLKVILDRVSKKSRERKWFFRQLEAVLCVDEALSDSDRDRLNSMATDVRGQAPVIGCAIGSPGTTAVPALIHFDSDAAANIGLPLPETFAKLAAAGKGYELHVKGPTVSPGLWRGAAAQAKTGDNEGFIATGITVEFVDPVRPYRGLKTTA